METFLQDVVVKDVASEEPQAKSCASSEAGRPRIADAPVRPPSPKRWVAQRKAEVVDAVSRGDLTCAQACELHAISIEEYLSWRANFAEFGLAGLHAGRAQRRRRLRAKAVLPDHASY